MNHEVQPGFGQYTLWGGHNQNRMFSNENSNHLFKNLIKIFIPSVNKIDKMIDVASGKKNFVFPHWKVISPGSCPNGKLSLVNPKTSNPIITNPIPKPMRILEIVSNDIFYLILFYNNRG